MCVVRVWLVSVLTCTISEVEDEMGSAAQGGDVDIWGRLPSPCEPIQHNIIHYHYYTINHNYILHICSIHTVADAGFTQVHNNSTFTAVAPSTDNNLCVWVIVPQPSVR